MQWWDMRGVRPKMANKERCDGCQRMTNLNRSGKCRTCRIQECKACGRKYAPYIYRSEVYSQCSYCKAKIGVTADPNMRAAL